MRCAFAVVALCFALAGCSGLAGAAASAAFGGGGPNVAANTQAGRTNVQAVGGVSVNEFRLDGVTADRVAQSSDESRVKADKVDQVVVNEAAQGLPVWVQFALGIFLWWLPSDREIGRLLRGWAATRRGRPIVESGSA